ncbi:MAG: hypothetical protein H8F28_24175 [Fibrella sp.]|nr:hypothetical protein [Armatimonadota bacterium]
MTKRLFHTEITQTPGTCFLSLNKLDEATVKGVAETMRHFAPEVLFAEVEAYEWTRGRMIAVGVLSIPVILLFIGLCVLFWKILFP